jgi:uncharacterized membrane protein YeaQ/YmgE (transglycosylase-associated protein family)
LDSLVTRQLPPHITPHIVQGRPLTSGFPKLDETVAAMGIISWIILGFIAGMLARWLTPGSGPQGCLITSVLGIAGAAIGGWMGTQLGMGTVTGFDIRSLFLAVIGSVVLLVAYAQLSGRGLRK